MQIKEFFDPATSTLSYVVSGSASAEAVVIDPVWNLDLASGQLSQASVNKILEYLEEENLELKMILETHAHADHLTGAQLLKKKYPKAVLAIGDRIAEVQGLFRDHLNFPSEFRADGSQFDRLLKDGEDFSLEELHFQVMHTPGHTPACCVYLIGGYAFVGDLIFMPDGGTGRCDFPGGSAKQLYHSIHEKLYSLPDATQLMMCHDYQPDGRDLKFQVSLRDQKEGNIHLKASTTEQEFVEFREDRDRSLSAPRLLYPSLQVNLTGGRLPEADSKGRRFLSIPLHEA
ncbi:MAG: MBL fold metallo-hydrolase [Bradymonadales bacterium]|nr:MAG: MBL fold metallo-hydrolase [Bradymonadales bacterium]